MNAAGLLALYQALDTKTRRVAFAWALYGQPTIPETHQEKCWAAMAEYRAAVADSSVEAINAFLRLTGSKSR